MTTELEQKFYDTFGIEKRYIILEDDCGQYKTHEKLYPNITAEKLLEMICILNSTNGINCTAYESKNIKDLEKEILNECIEIADDKELKQQVQALFMGEE